MVKLFRCAYVVTLVICSCSVNIRFDPKNTFLKNNNTLLRCYATVKSYPFIHDFVFYKNDEILTDKGGVPDFVGTEEYVVFKDLTVDSSGTYVCQVDGKNTTGEVFNEPDKPTPVVADVQGDVHIACPKGPPGAEGILNISNIDRRRVEIKSTRHSVIRNVGYEDVYDTGFCHYNFPSDKIIVTTEIHLIVVRKEVTIPHSDSETSRTVSCSAFSNITDISVTLTGSAKALPNRTYSATRISAELEGNATAVNCTVWYKGIAIWTSGIFIEGKSSSSGAILGIPMFVWIIVGVFVLGIIFGTVITCCRRHEGVQKAENERKERSSEDKAELTRLSGETGEEAQEGTVDCERPQGKQKARNVRQERSSGDKAKLTRLSGETGEDAQEGTVDCERPQDKQKAGNVRKERGSGNKILTKTDEDAQEVTVAYGRHQGKQKTGNQRKGTKQRKQERVNKIRKADEDVQMIVDILQSRKPNEHGKGTKIKRSDEATVSYVGRVERE